MRQLIFQKYISYKIASLLCLLLVLLKTKRSIALEMKIIEESKHSDTMKNQNGTNCTHCFKEFPLVKPSEYAAKKTDYNRIPSEKSKNVSESDQLRVEIRANLRAILVQFDEIDAIFSELIKAEIRNGTRRFTRSVPRCAVTYETITQFKTDVNSILSNVSGTEKSYCKISTDTSDECIKFIGLMQCGMDTFKNLLSNEINNLDSYDAIVKWKDAFQDLNAKYINAIGKDGLPKYNNELNTIASNLRDQKNIFYSVLYNFKEKYKNLCIEEISKGNSENAVIYFRKLRDSMLSQIIRTSYTNYGKVFQYENIANFISKLPTCSLHKIAYPTLFNVMHEDGALNGSEVLHFYEAIQRCMKGSSLEKELKIYSDRALQIWVRDFKQNDYSKVIDFAQKHINTIKIHLKELIKNVYDDNIEDILEFIRNLPQIGHDCIAFSSLLEQLKIHNKLSDRKLFMIAFRVKESMDMENYKNVEAECKQQFESVKATFSQPVRDIIWNGQRCAIRNDCYNEYLYAASDYFLHSEKRRRVFTWIKGGKVRESEWKFEAEQKGKHFTIMNTHWNEYLYAANDQFDYDESRRSIFTWGNKDKVIQGDWYLDPTEDGKLLIKNTVHSNYMYAGFDFKYDSERRRVFGWKPNEIPNSVKEEMKWIIECE